MAWTRRITLTIACTLGALAAPVAAHAATVSGTVPATAAPEGPGGSIVVRALDPETSALVTSARMAAPGPFTLEVPAGLYLVVATAADARRGEFYRERTRPFRVAADDAAQAALAPEPPAAAPPATPPATSTQATPPTSPPVAPAPPKAKKKKCKKPPPRCGRRRSARTKACRRAKAKYKKCRRAQRRSTVKARAATAGRPAIGVVEWTVDVDGHGPVRLWHSMITSIAQTCIQDEMDHVAAAASDIAMLDAEIALQQSEYVDPSTRVDPSKRIHATHHVAGEGHFDAQGNGTLTVNVRTAGGAHVTSVTVSGFIFDVTDAAARKLGELLCKRLRVQFTGERHNRLNVYACPPPNQNWFHNYDGSFVLDTPPEKLLAFPKGAGWTNLTGTVTWTDAGNDGTEQGSEPTGDYLDFAPADDGRIAFSLKALSFNPALKKAGFSASWDELIGGTTTWPVDISWDRHGTDQAGCTYDDDGRITGTFTVTPTAKVAL